MILVPIVFAAMLAGPMSVPLKVSFVTAIAAHVADIGTTTACVSPGWCKEANPALRWAGRDALKLSLNKGLLAGALQLIPYKLATSGHPKWAFWFNVGQTVAFTALAVHNDRFSRQPR